MTTDLSTITTTVESGFDAGLHLHQLELRRLTLYREIDNMSLPQRERDRARDEADFLIDYAKARRVQLAIHEWRKVREGYAAERLSAREELRNRIVLERARIRMRLFDDKRTRIHLTLDILERIKRLKPKDETRSFIARGQRELLQQRLANRLARNTHRHLQDQLAEMVLARGRFLRKLREQFPDLEDDLMDRYDSELFRRAAR